MKLWLAHWPAFARTTVSWTAVLMLALVIDASGSAGFLFFFYSGLLAALGGTFGLVAANASTRQHAEYFGALPSTSRDPRSAALDTGMWLAVGLACVFLLIVGTGVYATLLRGLRLAANSSDARAMLEAELVWPAHLLVVFAAYWFVVRFQQEFAIARRALRRWPFLIATCASLLSIGAGFVIAAGTLAVEIGSGWRMFTLSCAEFVFAGLAALYMRHRVRVRMNALGCDGVPDDDANEDSA